MAAGTDPLRRGDRRDGRRRGGPPHFLRPYPAAGRVPHGRLPIRRRTSRHLPAWRSGPRWMVQARPPAALIRHRTPQHAGLAAMGHTRPAGPNAMVGGLLDLAICRLLPGGPHPWPHPRRSRRWYGAQDLHPIIAADAALAGHDLGALGAVRPPVGFRFGSVLHRPSLVHITTTFEAVRPGGSDGA